MSPGTDREESSCANGQKNPCTVKPKSIAQGGAGINGWPPAGPSAPSRTIRPEKSKVRTRIAVNASNPPPDFTFAQKMLTK